MPTLFKPATDEFLLGWVSRLAHVNASKSCGEMLDTLVDNFSLEAKHRPVTGRYYRAEAYLDALACVSGKSALMLLADHSNFVAEGYPTARAARWLNKALHQPRGSHPSIDSPRLCNECIFMQMLEPGHSFWNRQHQLEGLFWCPLHKIALLTANPWFAKEMWIPSASSAIKQTPATSSDLERYPVLRIFLEVMIWFLRHRSRDIIDNIRQCLIEKAITARLAYQVDDMTSEPYRSICLSDIAFSQCPEWWLNLVFDLRRPADDKGPLALNSIFSREIQAPSAAYALGIALLFSPREQADLLKETSEPTKLQPRL